MVGIILQRVLCIRKIIKLIIFESGGDIRLNSGLFKMSMSRYHSDHSESEILIVNLLWALGSH